MNENEQEVKLRRAIASAKGKGKLNRLFSFLERTKNGRATGVLRKIILDQEANDIDIAYVFLEQLRQLKELARNLPEERVETRVFEDIKYTRNILRDYLTRNTAQHMKIPENFRTSALCAEALGRIEYIETTLEMKNPLREYREHDKEDPDSNRRWA